MTRAAGPGPLRWALLCIVSLGCLAGALAFGFGGFLLNGEFASGPRQPLLAALAWGISAGAAGTPVAVLPLLGMRVQQRTAVLAAGTLAAIWFIVGFVLLAG